MLPAYVERNRLLKELGFESYRAYLSSPLWRGIRERVMKAHRRKCGLCGKRADQVHHCDYSRSALLGESLLHYLPACDPCHEKHEWDGDRKRSPEEVFEVMRRTFMARMDRKPPKHKSQARIGKTAVRAAIRQQRKRRLGMR